MIKDVLKTLVKAAFFVLVVGLFLTHTLIISLSAGKSMSHSGKNEVYIAVGYKTDDINYGDVTILFNGPSGTSYLKRVIGLPGDTVEIINGDVYINGKLNNDYEAIKCDILMNKDAVTLGEDEYYIIGDNRANSYDSRYIGPVKLDNIVHLFKITDF